jgi:hypothetical protein
MREVVGGVTGDSGGLRKEGSKEGRIGATK